ncbi:hypothetical protein [Thermococcus sp. JCM 11816]|uniref:hypothetical protein n=1 Tax=Thermococcus sp. (strain JCM 11816 / KS-1) TaxID=1295125 RepID=UPI0006D1ADBD
MSEPVPIEEFVQALLDEMPESVRPQVDVEIVEGANVAWLHFENGMKAHLMSSQKGVRVLAMWEQGIAEVKLTAKGGLQSVDEVLAFLVLAGKVRKCLGGGS